MIVLQPLIDRLRLVNNAALGVLSDPLCLELGTIASDLQTIENLQGQNFDMAALKLRHDTALEESRAMAQRCQGLTDKVTQLKAMVAAAQASETPSTVPARPESDPELATLRADVLQLKRFKLQWESAHDQLDRFFDRSGITIETISGNVVVDGINLLIAEIKDWRARGERFSQAERCQREWQQAVDAGMAIHLDEKSPEYVGTLPGQSSGEGTVIADSMFAMAREIRRLREWQDDIVITVDIWCGGGGHLGGLQYDHSVGVVGAIQAMGNLIMDMRRDSNIVDRVAWQDSKAAAQTWLGTGGALDDLTAASPLLPAGIDAMGKEIVRLRQRGSAGVEAAADLISEKNAELAKAYKNISELMERLEAFHRSGNLGGLHGAVSKAEGQLRPATEKPGSWQHTRDVALGNIPALDELKDLPGHKSLLWNAAEEAVSILTEKIRESTPAFSCEHEVRGLCELLRFQASLLGEDGS